MQKEKVILIIMDGWGIAENPVVSALDAARTPFYDEARRKYPFSRLEASGNAVGLPEGQMGNSEVGHMNIGAGRVVYQDLVRINRSLDSGDIAANPGFRQLIKYCRDNQKPLHLMGLLSDGGVHSHIRHLKGLLRLLSQEVGMPPVYIHCFMDGRDTDPHSGLGHIQDLEAACREYETGRIASVVGRYYAMDRNQQWGRIRKAFDLLTRGRGNPFHSAEEAVQASYDADVTDEFMLPTVITEKDDSPVGLVQPGDAVLFFNFRTDRGRQLTTALTQRNIREFNMHTLELYFSTLTRYDETFEGVHVLFGKEDIDDGLGETLSKAGKKQIRIAETEKYAHVTFFFNGGREEEWEGESRILCQSPNVATYDMKPEMSAFEVRDKIIAAMEEQGPDFICLNFANPDMVGHTGVWEAAVKACATVDQCTRDVVEAALQQGYHALITADHGNCDKMLNADGSPNTAHTTARVPFIFVPRDDRAAKMRDGKLGDIAPTVLKLLGLEQPAAMTGECLIEE